MDKGVIIRTIVLAIALINQVLTSTGHAVIPVHEEEISIIVTAVAAIWSWWKNNSFTKKAREADRYLKQLKEAK